GNRTRVASLEALADNHGAGQQKFVPWSPLIRGDLHDCDLPPATDAGRTTGGLPRPVAPRAKSLTRPRSTVKITAVRKFREQSRPRLRHHSSAPTGCERPRGPL